MVIESLNTLVTTPAVFAKFVNLDKDELLIQNNGQQSENVEKKKLTEKLV